MAKKKATETHPDQIDNGLRVDLGTLANELRLRTEERDRVASERGRWSNLLKQADEAVEHATAAIVAASRPGQMPLIPAATRDEDEADEPTIVPDGVTLSGTTGGPVDETESYAMTMSSANPNECVCGWEIASPIPGHDRRHAQYLRSRRGDGDVGERAFKKGAGPRDLTAAVAKRRTSTKKPAGKKKAARR